MQKNSLLPITAEPETLQFLRCRKGRLLDNYLLFLTHESVSFWSKGPAAVRQIHLHPLLPLNTSMSLRNNKATSDIVIAKLYLMFSRRPDLPPGKPNTLEELGSVLLVVVCFCISQGMVWFLWGMDGGGVGNFTVCKQAWDMASFYSSISHVGFVFLVFGRWTGHLRVCESCIGKKHSEQTENGNFPLVDFSWPMGGNTGQWLFVPMAGSTGSSPASRSPQTEEGCHTDTAKCHFMPCPMPSLRVRRTGKEQFCFLEASGLNVWLLRRETNYFSCSKAPL